MEKIKLEAKERTPGKGGARAARREQEVPCVLYGGGIEPLTFQLPELSLRPLIYTAEMHRVEISLAGEQYDCILKEMKFHPVTDRPFHADFQVLRRGEMISMMVPVQYHGNPRGVREGGDMQIVAHELEVSCLPQDIPSSIEVDVSHLAIGDLVHLREVMDSYPGVNFSASPDSPLVTIHAPRVVEEETEEVAGETEVAADEDEG